MQDCLVLDASYRPIGFCHWQSAIKLIWEEVATVVKEDEAGKQLHSPSMNIAFPRVIRVHNYIAKKLKKALAPNRLNIAARDNNECQYCGVFVNDKEATLDHVLPRSRGGKNTWSNLVLACKPCNRFKNDRTPEEAGMQLLSNPVEPLLLQKHVKQIRKEWKDWEGMGLF